MTLVLIALLSGLLHAGWNAIAKRTGSQLPPGLGTWLIVFASWICTLVLFLFDPALPPRAAVPWLLVAAVGEAVYTIALARAYQFGALAVTYAYTRSAAMILIWPLTWLVFGTPPTTGALIGTPTLLVGIYLTYAASRVLPNQPQNAQASGSSFSLLWSTLSAASVAAYHTGYKGAALAGAPVVSGYGFAVVVATLLMTPMMLGKLKALRRDHLATLRPIALAGLLATFSFLLTLYALRFAHSGMVLSVRNSSIAFASVLAYFQGERPSRKAWCGVLVILLGAFLFAYQG